MLIKDGIIASKLKSYSNKILVRSDKVSKRWYNS